MKGLGSSSVVDVGRRSGCKTRGIASTPSDIFKAACSLFNTKCWNRGAVHLFIYFLKYVLRVNLVFQNQIRPNLESSPVVVASSVSAGNNVWRDCREQKLQAHIFIIAVHSASKILYWHKWFLISKRKVRQNACKWVLMWSGFSLAKRAFCHLYESLCKRNEKKSSSARIMHIYFHFDGFIPSLGSVQLVYFEGNSFQNCKFAKCKRPVQRIFCFHWHVFPSQTHLSQGAVRGRTAEKLSRFRSESTYSSKSKNLLLAKFFALTEFHLFCISSPQEGHRFECVGTVFLEETRRNVWDRSPSTQPENRPHTCDIRIRSGAQWFLFFPNVKRHQVMYFGLLEQKVGERWDAWNGQQWK